MKGPTSLKHTLAKSMAAASILLLAACSSPSAVAEQETVPEPAPEQSSTEPTEKPQIPEEFDHLTVGEARGILEQNDVEVILDHPDFGDAADEQDVSGFADSFSIPEDGVRFSSDRSTATIQTVVSEGFANRFLPFKLKCTTDQGYDSVEIDYYTLDSIWEDGGRSTFESCVAEVDPHRWEPTKEQERLIAISKQGEDEGSDLAWMGILEECALEPYDGTDSWVMTPNTYRLVAAAEYCPDAPHAEDLKAWLKANPPA